MASLLVSRLILRGCCRTTPGLHRVEFAARGLLPRRNTIMVSQNHLLSISHKTRNQKPASSNDLTSSIEDEPFTTFYHFPYIIVTRLISRLKIYQTGLTIVVLPPVYVQYALGQMEASNVAMVTGIAAFAGMMLYVISHYTRRLVGLLAINKNRDVLRISHLTFWGNRNNIYVPVEKVVPLSDMADCPNDAYLKLCFYDSKNYFYYTLRYGSVINKDIFHFVLGSL